MSAHRPKLVFFGTDAFSVPSLIRLVAEEWPVVAVVTKPDSPTGRGRALTSPAVKRLADARNITVFQPHRLTEIESELRALQADAGIVVAYGRIIPPRVINLFSHGLINVHASLLPRHRGAAPIEAAILAGDTETGVTLMRIDAGLDTGPTFDVAKLQLTGAETRPDLYEQLAELGADLLAAKLPGILSGDIVPVPQDNLRATVTKLIAKADGVIDWTQPAETIERQIRGYLLWPGSRTTLAGADVTITAAHLAPQTGPAGMPFKAPSGELGIHTGTTSLIIDRLKPAGKREMTGLEFLAGHRLKP